jgi:hypothetical protein
LSIYGLFLKNSLTSLPRTLRRIQFQQGVNTQKVGFLLYNFHMIPAPVLIAMKLLLGPGIFLGFHGQDMEMPRGAMRARLRWLAGWRRGWLAATAVRTSMYSYSCTY